MRTSRPLPPDIEGPSWSYAHRGYALLESCRRLGRYRIATLLTLAVLGITMTLPALFLFLSDELQQLPIGTHKGQSMTLYLDLSISDLDAAAIADNLRTKPQVAAVDYVSPADALTEFQSHTNIDEALDILGGNPLPGAIVVHPSDDSRTPQTMKLLADELALLPEVDRVQLDLQWVERLDAVIALARICTIVLGVLLTLTALMVISNTIRLEMSRHARQIEVTRLLGATRRFVRRPFLYQGALYGFLGSLLACVTAIGLQAIISPPVTRLASTYGSQFSLSAPTLIQLAQVIVSGTVLGLVGSLLALFWQQYRQADE